MSRNIWTGWTCTIMSVLHYLRSLVKLSLFYLQKRRTVDFIQSIVCVYGIFFNHTAVAVKIRRIFNWYWSLISWHFISPKRIFYFNVVPGPRCRLASPRPHAMSPNHGDRSTPMHIAHRIMYAGAVHFAFCNYKAGCCCVGCTESDCDCDLLAVKQ